MDMFVEMPAEFAALHGDWTKLKSYGDFPWQFVDSNCTQGWHKCSFEHTREGPRQSRFSDGDWEAIGEEDLPTHMENLIAWREYLLWVCENGSDPIRALTWPQAKRVTRAWRFKFRVYANKIWLTEVVGPRGVYTHLGNLPPYVWDFLELCDEVPPPGSRLCGLLVGGLDSWEEFKDVVPGIKLNRYKKFSIDEWIHPSEEKVKEHLRKGAAAWLRKVRAGLAERRKFWLEDKLGFWSDELEREYRKYRIPRRRRDDTAA
jgi:hypothetical protein